MRMITKEQLEALRSRYPAGTRVELLQMDDVQAPPIGTKGTVTGVDDTGSLGELGQRLRSECHLRHRPCAEGGGLRWMKR